MALSNLDSSINQSLCHVFVYGTLKPDQENFAKYCGSKVIASQNAIAFGQLFALPMGYPAMVLSEQNSIAVKGYRLTFADTSILESLDELEDYNCDRNPADNLYNRQLLEIFDLNQQSLGLAWVYLMTAAQVQNFAGIPQADGYWTAENGIKN
ncbi:gamma-glutamylcyclotransferase family protein [Pseudanabaena mucicola]|uniref:Gamma-glutamylcyclotransferase n=1 Tax=Pseudanabaena mucicola FACHB-723 TaxID=2692860 RepID=A0ABR8A0K7_9CYAN|nr:gamma-glutamylcyclotransferase family protein [Pseudanabaena mucicola]MBD2189752.1 gamma-glutamylcyclotransferase [Pseudanabaena mucicola FACHB-723]